MKTSDCMEPSQHIHSPTSGSCVSMLAHFNKMSIQVGQPVRGLHIFRNLAKEEINRAAINMSKSGPIICVNSYYAETE